MVIKGRSRGNGAQLADYLLNNRENDRAQVLDVRGTSRPHDLKKSLLEMSLSSELTKGIHGLYHAQINPAIGEDQPMTPEDWQQAADILERHLGFDGQKRVIVLHEKKGRIHAHIVWERYDQEYGILKIDGKNYKKHDAARSEIEQVLQHKLTPQREQNLQPEQVQKKSDIKRELSDLWEQTADGKSFMREAEKAGYQIAKADDRRPWRVITPEGESFDLVRQLENAKTKDVRERLQPIRDDMKTEAEALEIMRGAIQNEKTPELEHSDKGQELADSQALAMAMIDKVQQDKKSREEQETESPDKRDLLDSQELAAAMLKRQKPEPERNKFQGYSYSVTFKQHTPDRSATPTQPEKTDLSDSQEVAAGLIKKHLEQAERGQKMKELLEQASDQTQPQAPQYYNPVTGQEMTPEGYKKMEEFLERQKQREQERKSRDRGGYER